MITTLKGTTAQAINNAIVQARRFVGMGGLVFTMIVVADRADYDRAMAACIDAGREHPSRILLVTDGTSKTTRLDAEIRVGEGVPGEIVSLRFQGELRQHRDSVLLPLLLPDSPVIVWWPGSSPADPGQDPIGKLGSRRITDAMGAADPIHALEIRAEHHSRGDTDLTWTRLTPWRALLAAAIDQYPSPIQSVHVAASPDNAAATLLAAWLEARLNVPVERSDSAGPGITGVVMKTEKGDISIVREDGMMAQFSAPGIPKRGVALRRRDINALITEELRRMDADDIFEQATQMLLSRCHRTPAPKRRRRTVPARLPESPQTPTVKARRERTGQLAAEQEIV